MKIWKVTIAYFVAFLIQGSLVNIIAIGEQTPNLLLALTIALSYLYEEKPMIMVCSAVFGLLQDICYGIYIGPSGILLTLVAVAMYTVNTVSLKENFIAFLISSVASIVGYQFGYWILAKIAGYPGGILTMVQGGYITSLYTLVVAFLIYIVLLVAIAKRNKKYSNYGF